MEGKDLIDQPMFGPSVFGVGVNKEHIIIKEHPLRDCNIDNSKTLYYVIPLVKKISSEGEKNYYELTFHCSRHPFAPTVDQWCSY